MQHEKDNFVKFSERTERLALKMGKNLKDLPDLIGISSSVFFSNRSGARPISAKTWRKLEQFENKKGFQIAQNDDDMKVAQFNTAVRLNDPDLMLIQVLEANISAVRGKNYSLALKLTDSVAGELKLRLNQTSNQKDLS